MIDNIIYTISPEKKALSIVHTSNNIYLYFEFYILGIFWKFSLNSRFYGFEVGITFD